MVQFEWFSSHQLAFDKNNKVIGTEIQVLLFYPDFNKRVLFHLYNVFSDHQLGAVIMQYKKRNSYGLLFPKSIYSLKAMYNY
jgi:hypothetical protein